MAQVLRDWVPLKDRCDLRLRPVTLNGNHATIDGLLDRLATVTDTITGQSARWTWPQVEYVITEKSGAFTCPALPGGDCR